MCPHNNCQSSNLRQKNMRFQSNHSKNLMSIVHHNNNPSSSESRKNIARLRSNSCNLQDNYYKFLPSHNFRCHNQNRVQHCKRLHNNSLCSTRFHQNKLNPRPLCNDLHNRSGRNNRGRSRDNPRASGCNKKSDRYYHYSRKDRHNSFHYYNLLLDQHNLNHNPLDICRRCSRSGRNNRILKNSFLRWKHMKNNLHGIYHLNNRKDPHSKGLHNHNLHLLRDIGHKYHRCASHYSNCQDPHNSLMGNSDMMTVFHNIQHHNPKHISHHSIADQNNSFRKNIHDLLDNTHNRLDMKRMIHWSCIHHLHRKHRIFCINHHSILSRYNNL